MLWPMRSWNQCPLTNQKPRKCHYQEHHGQTMDDFIEVDLHLQQYHWSADNKMVSCKIATASNSNIWSSDKVILHILTIKIAMRLSGHSYHGWSAFQGLYLNFLHRGRTQRHHWMGYKAWWVIKSGMEKNILPFTNIRLDWAGMSKQISL